MTNVPANETNTYWYDTLNRLTSWTLNNGQPEIYGYSDTTGNLSSKAGVAYNLYDANHAHAVASLTNGNSYSYDANGNMITRTVNGQTFNFGYDAENRLVSVSGAATASFVYDGDGNRVQSIIGGTTTIFVGNYYEVTGSSITKNYYAGTQLIATRKGGALSYLLSDHLGSTSLAVDSSRTVTASQRFTPWGEVRAPSGTMQTSYSFTGQYSDSYINLLYYGSREYDPAIGRFISPDTIVPTSTQGVQAWDRYGYVNNNPVTYNDPTGHVGDDWWNDEPVVPHPYYYASPSLNVQTLQQDPLPSSNCGETSIAMAYDFAHNSNMTVKNATDDATNWGLYTKNNPPFTSTAQMVSIAQHYAGDTQSGHVDANDPEAGMKLIMGQIQKGNPVIVDYSEHPSATNTDLDANHAHYVVVTGFSIDSRKDEQLSITYNDPEYGKSTTTDWKTFQNTWYHNNDYNIPGDNAGNGWWMVIPHQ